MVAAAAILTVSAVLSPKKQVKHVEKLEAMWSSADGIKGRNSKRVLYKETNTVNVINSSVRGGRSEVLRVLRKDAEFIGSATAPMRKAIGDFFWLRFLEKKTVPEPKPEDDVVTAPPQQEFPVLSPYPPGMVCPYYKNLI